MSRTFTLAIAAAAVLGLAALAPNTASAHDYGYRHHGYHQGYSGYRHDHYGYYPTYRQYPSYGYESYYGKKAPEAYEKPEVIEKPEVVEKPVETCDRIEENGCYFAKRKFSSPQGDVLRCTKICDEEKPEGS